MSITFIRTVVKLDTTKTPMVLSKTDTITKLVRANTPYKLVITKSLI